MIKKIARKIFPNFYTKLWEVKRSIVARKLKKEHPNTKIFHNNHYPNPKIEIKKTHKPQLV